MPTVIEAYRVFIASPGGLDDERGIIREEIQTFNDKHMHDFGIAFSAHGWEFVSATVNRPQEQINQVVRMCDYMILTLASRWGSPSSQDGPYSSGTEEEYIIGRACVADPTMAMCDIAVLFKGVPEEQLRDPGKQLLKVLEFKAELQAKKELLYSTYDELEEYRRKIADRLLDWAKERRGGVSVGPPDPADGSPPPEEGKDVTELGVEDASSQTSVSALERAEDYERRGLMTQAEAGYAVAIADDDLASLQKYARFLRRSGRLSRSLEMNERVLDLLARSEESTDTADERARVLTNIGIVHRKLGQTRKSRYALNEAVQTARTADGDTSDALAYALDNLGITAARTGDVSAAAECFEESLDLRRRSGDVPGQAKALTNLARLSRRQGQSDLARAQCLEALEILGDTGDPAALASTYSTLGEIEEEQSNLDQAERAYRSALGINESLGMPDNIAMSLSQVARVVLERGEPLEARQLAERALEENQQTANREGTIAANHLLGRILGQLAGEESVAAALLEEAAQAYAELKNPSGEAWAWLHLAELQKRLGQVESAESSLAQATALGAASRNAGLRSALAAVAE